MKKANSNGILWQDIKKELYSKERIKEAENIMNTAKMHAVDTGDFSVLDINSSIFEKRGIAKI